MPKHFACRTYRVCKQIVISRLRFGKIATYLHLCAPLGRAITPLCCEVRYSICIKGAAACIVQVFRLDSCVPGLEGTSTSLGDKIGTHVFALREKYFPRGKQSEMIINRGRYMFDWLRLTGPEPKARVLYLGHVCLTNRENFFHSASSRLAAIAKRPLPG